MRVVSSPAQRARGRRIDLLGQVGLLRHCLTIGIEIAGPVALDPIQGALDWVVWRHPALRSVFQNGWDQHVVRHDVRVPVTRKLIAGTDPDRRWDEAVAFAYQDRMRPFDLAAGPLVRATLLSAAADRHLLVLSFDQLVIDAQSAIVVVQELVDHAHLLATGAPLPPEEPDGYPELRRKNDEWLRGQAGRAAVAARLGALAGTKVGLPWRRVPDLVQPDELTHSTMSLPDAVSEVLLARARELRVVPFAVALAAFALVVANAEPPAGERHAVTSMFAARSTRAEQAVVGWLSNQVAVVTPQWTATVEDCVRAAQREVMAALDAQRVPVGVEGPPESDDLTASLMYLPAQLSGGTQTDLLLGTAAARRMAVSFCPTGADVDFLIAERMRRLTGEEPRLAVGATSVRGRVGTEQLADLVTQWAEALAVLASVPWHTPASDVLGRLRDRLSVAAASGKG